MHWIVIVCCCLGAASAGYTPAPPGGRPPCAERGATFCESVDPYPTKVIKRLLQSKSLSMEDFFTDESEGLNEPPDYILHEDMMLLPEEDKGRKVRSIRDLLKERFGAKELTKRCPVSNKEALPRMAANGAGEWRFIVQDEQDKATQKIQVQLCEDSEECKKQCIQLYAPVAMVSLDASGNAFKDTFWMPSSCRCQNTPLNDQ